MTPFTVRTLERADIDALLAFETENREWFQSHIDARDPAFYSVQGVGEHVQAYLSDFAVGAWHPFVIEDANAHIVGRANLKNINSPLGCAEVGYRIGQRFCGQGLATLAVRQLIQTAQRRWHLTQLVAHVYRHNVGSSKVLDRCGFLVDPQSWADETQKECRFSLSI
ncbi:MAG: GNAT family N-acetyltransferase [Pseudomonas sp.]|uniref:GNAT family N-acetyltransferase n=1 Tax=Pseudomonas abieticivorans TaxID=2931382 RepID=UPI0020C149FB|nr:GNAT family N-acetyltransferase [Pseudomonas sp. PIA16]MDE1169328.1 GNAT family N-acetyltransferase [Pseudomonas sp.]